jgi:hypothetical protein
MEGVTSDVTTDVTPDVPEVLEEVPEEVPLEVPESLEAELLAQPRADLPELEAQTEALPELQASRPRVRKIRIKDTPPPKPEPGYWSDRLQEHRATQRAAKSERYANLPIM